MTDIEALRSRVDEFDEWLREGGNADVVNLLCDLVKELDKLTWLLNGGPSMVGAYAQIDTEIKARDEYLCRAEAAEARIKALEQAIDHFSRRLRFACFDGHRAVEKIADEMVALTNARQKDTY